jgi:hypothetical protein
MHVIFKATFSSLMEDKFNSLKKIHACEIFTAKLCFKNNQYLSPDPTVPHCIPNIKIIQNYRLINP